MQYNADSDFKNRKNVKSP